MIPLSVCIITKNEEARIGACLSSVDWASDVVVVDDHSDDATPVIVRSRPGVRLENRTFDGFGAQKNYAVSLARNDWVLSLDADEVVTPELAAEIRAVVSGHEDLSGCSIRRKNLWFGAYRTDSPPGSLRLFRKSAGGFLDRSVHERVEVKGKVRMLDHVLLHHPKSFESFSSHYQTYVLRYGRLAAQDYFKRGERVTALNAIWKIVLLPMAAFVREYVIRGRLKQGKAGLYVSFCSAMNYHVAYRHLRLIQNGAGADEPVPAEEYTREYFLRHRGGSGEFSRSQGRELYDAHRFALEMADPRPHEDVLDFGCGCGEVALHAARTARSVLGIDYSKDAIELAREAQRHFDPAAAARVKFVVADAGTFKLPENGFDLILFLDVIEHLTQAEIEAVLPKLRAALKPGGRLLTHTWPNRWHRAYAYPLVYRLGRLTGNKTRPRDPRTHFEAVMHVSEQSPFELKGRLHRAGFSRIRVFLRHPHEVSGSLYGRFYGLVHTVPPFKWFFCDHIWSMANK